jgi:hypothetical protein
VRRAIAWQGSKQATWKMITLSTAVNRGLMETANAAEHVDENVSQTNTQVRCALTEESVKNYL